jgi:alpha-beta hydrolase superfamily lysophospholipase
VATAAALTAFALLGAGCGSDDEASGAPPRAELPDPGPLPPTVPQPTDPGDPGALVAARERPDEVAGRRSWAITYASTTAAGEPVAVTGQVVVPAGEPPAGGWPVVAWGHPTTGTSDRCTPSHEGSSAIHNIAELTAAGIAVAATDYEGLGTEGGHPYLVGSPAARNMLDAVRAAAAIEGSGIGPASPVVLSGFSQGGHAALWAAQEAPDYAPELDVRGVQAVAPVTDVVQFAERAESYDAQVGVLATIVWGLSVAHPELDVADVLTTDGLALLYAAEDRCIAEVVVAYTHPVDEIVRRSPRTIEPWRGLLEENTAAQVGLDVPVHVLRGGADPIVYESVTREAVDRLCRQDTLVQYDVVAGVDHGVLTPERTVPWIVGLLGGDEPPGNCP